jgi:hypothetical protein
VEKTRKFSQIKHRSGLDGIIEAEADECKSPVVGLENQILLKIKAPTWMM